MHIIIVGCGKVGRTLAEQLQEEETDLTLIDMDADVINDLTESLETAQVSILLWKPVSRLLTS